MTKKRISVEPYKGVRDFYPEEMRIQNYILDTMRKTAESFGYLEYSASLLESAELFEEKSGEEIVREQMYTFEDKGGRRVALRPEMTPSLARMVAKRRRDYPLPIRWFSVPNVFRYERPQRGRLREHWQLNADIFGVRDVEADIEIISLAYQIMKNFKADNNDFEIRINDISLRNEWFKKEYGITNENTLKEISRTLDRKQKIADEVLNKQLTEVLPENARDRLETLRDELEMDIDSFVRLVNAETQHLAIIQVFNGLKRAGIKNIKFDATLSRGFDYYTGVVFEVFDTSPENNRSLFGGGRYDNLLEVFGEEHIPAVGFGMGDVTIRDFLKTHNLPPTEYISSTDLYIYAGTREVHEHALRLAKFLRKRGINVALNLVGMYKGIKIDKALKNTDKRKVPFFLYIDDKEETSNVYQMRNMRTNDVEQSMEKEKLAIFLKRYRAKSNL